MIVSSILVSFGQLLWKLSHARGVLFLGIGFLVYAIGALLMILAYKYGKLSVLQPILSLSYVFAVILGYFVFNDELSVGRLASIAIIISGVLVISRDK